MTNQWRMVPVEPTDDMITAGQDQEWTEEVYTAMVAAAPVPPAGDVEVLGYGMFNEFVCVLPEDLDRQCAHVTRLQTLVDASEHVQEHLSQQIDIERIGRESAERIVARLTAEIAENNTRQARLQELICAAEKDIKDLTAERDGEVKNRDMIHKQLSGWQGLAAERLDMIDTLRADNNVLDALCEQRFDEIAALQSELTKARELLIPEECPHMIVFDDADREPLMFAGSGARTAALKTWEQISGSWNAHLFVRIERNSRDDRYPSAYQSAPAAKGDI